MQTTIILRNLNVFRGAETLKRGRQYPQNGGKIGRDYIEINYANFISKIFLYETFTA